MFTFFENLIDAYPEGDEKQPPNTLVAFFWHYSKDAWPVLFIMSVFTAILSLVEVVLFGFLGNIVDWLSSANPATFIQEEKWALIGMLVVVLLLMPLLGLVHTLFSQQAIFGNFAMAIRWRMHRYLLQQSLGFYSDEFAGRIATKVMQSALSLRDTLVVLLDVMVYVAVYFAGSLFLAASFHWTLATPFVLWLVVYSVMLYFLLPRMAYLSKRQADARSLMTGRVVDSYTNITTVKLFAHTRFEEDYAQNSMDQFLHTVYPSMRLSSKLDVGIQILNAFLIAGCGGIGIWQWIAGNAGPGAVAVAMGLALRLNGIGHWLMWELVRLFESVGVVQDGMNMMSLPITVKNRPGAVDIEAAGKPVRFENNSFSYGNDGHVIENLSLDIKPGQKIGLVGRSGAGKTTLTNILLRFYELRGGRVMIGDTDIADITQDSLRRNVGVVTQDTSLLHRSIRENIAYSRPDASDEEIIDAAKKANAWEFISELHDKDGNRGLDAQVGERGVKLSGGQRQRIAIARIFLKNAPILVLDEATSALDSEVEAAIQENLFKLMEGKTVMAIAHRLSTIAQMDKLVVMDKGKIVESGTHEALVDAGGIYADLWSRQSGGFLVDGEPEVVQ